MAEDTAKNVAITSAKVTGKAVAVTARTSKNLLIVVFHVCTLGIFLIPHALLHYITKKK